MIDKDRKGQLQDIVLQQLQDIVLQQFSGGSVGSDIEALDPSNEIPDTWPTDIGLPDQKPRAMAVFKLPGGETAYIELVPRSELVSEPEESSGTRDFSISRIDFSDLSGPAPPASNMPGVGYPVFRIGFLGPAGGSTGDIRLTTSLELDAVRSQVNTQGDWVWWTEEVVVDSDGKTFRTLHTPSPPQTLEVLVRGLIYVSTKTQKPDFTLSGNTGVFSQSQGAGARFPVKYRYALIHYTARRKPDREQFLGIPLGMALSMATEEI